MVTPRSRDESMQSGISITTDYDYAPAIKSYKVAFVMWMLASNERKCLSFKNSRIDSST